MSLDIQNCLTDTGISSKIELVEATLEIIEQKHSHEHIEQAAKRHMLAIHKKHNIHWSNYDHIGTKYSPGYLVALLVYGYLSKLPGDKQIISLNELLVYLKGFQESKRPLITQKAVNGLMDLVAETGFSMHKLKRKLPLVIVYIPFQNSEANGYFYPGFNMISLHKPADGIFTPEFIFLHEIGHLFADRLSDDPMTVPDCFKEFNKDFGFKESFLHEIFADFFALSILADSALDDKIPTLPKITAKHIQSIKEYMRDLIRKRLS